jgi:hypothetical protein
MAGASSFKACLFEEGLSLVVSLPNAVAAIITVHANRSIFFIVQYLKRFFKSGF